MADYKFDTLKVKAGYNPREHNDSVAVPIYSTASYEIEQAERYDRIAAGEEKGNLYSRVSNPTVEVLEKRIAALDGGSSAVAVGSGVAAITYSLFALTENGGRILTTYQLYGGLVHHLDYLFPKFGVKIDKVENGSSIETFEKAIKEDTKAIYVESVSNPTATISDIESLANLAHKYNIPLVVDNTVATPYLFNPIKYGADIVVYSATKGISGHGTAIGGLVVDSGNFNWDNDRFPQFKENNIVLRDINGNDRNYIEVFGKDAFAGKIRQDYLTNFGSVLSPFDAYIILIGLETLSERIDKQIKNTEKIVDFLNCSDEVEWVSYPLLKNSPYYALAKKYFPKGVGGLFSFGFKGNQKQIYKIMNNVKVFSYQLNLGDARSLIVNALRTSHEELTEEELKLAGIPDNTIRVSVGLEDAEDLINDLDNAFKIALS